MWKPVVATLVLTQLCAAAVAARDVPFTFTMNLSPAGPFYVQCNGPWFRTSGCAKIESDNYQNWNFYTAQDNPVFSIMDEWDCWVTTSGPEQGCFKHTQPTEVFFRIDDKTTAVQLFLEGQNLRVEGAAPLKARAVFARSVLGQNGEDDSSPAQDVDTYSFEGRPGEKVEIRLGRDGSGGSAGEVATVHVRAANGAVLGQRSGAVPLSLDVTLPGTVEIAVSRRPGGGDPLRGYYDLEVVPRSGGVGERRLRPSLNVEQ